MSNQQDIDHLVIISTDEEDSNQEEIKLTDEEDSNQEEIELSIHLVRISTDEEDFNQEEIETDEEDSNQEEIELPTYLVRINTDEDFTQQLKVPIGFIKLFNGVIPTDRIILIKSSCSTGRCWWVKMLKTDQDHLIFKDGWLNFVENNSLEFGDSILFEKIQDLQLVFTIFNKNGSQKGLENNNTTVNIQQQGLDWNEPITVSSTDSNHVTDGSEEMSPDEESESRGQDDDHGMTDSNEPIAAEGESPVFKLVITELQEGFITPYPFFTVSFSESYLAQLHIPLDFAKKYLPQSSSTESCTLIHVSKEDMRSFEAGIRYHPHCESCKTMWSITSGWKQFVQAIGLRKGDACAFELIEKDELKIKVSIFRDIGGKPPRVIEI